MEIENLKTAYHKCDREPDSIAKKVRIDLENGNAWSFVSDTYYWFPTYKSCCHFYEDEECLKEILHESVVPNLKL